MSDSWKNRIVRTSNISPEKLTANPKNWRSHPKHQREALKAVLDEVGWVQQVIVNKTTGLIIDGHLRVAMAIERNEKKIPVNYVELNEEEEALILATIDPIAAMANIDSENLNNLLQELDIENEEINQMLNKLAKEAGIDSLGQDLQDPDDSPELSKKVITNYGDIWLLGEHRIMCGDSTMKEDVNKLLNGAKPRLCITDPPYGVEYNPAWRGNLNKARRRTGEIENDDRLDWEETWLLSPSDIFYCWHADRHASVVQKSMEAAAYKIRCQIIWSKPHFVIGRGHYSTRHEPCWYAVRKGAKAHWIGDRSQSTIWEISLDKNVEGGHSTQKPVECMERPLRNHKGDVYDPFIGSGTTLIAAERLKRRCYGMEIDPHYVDVIIKRWQNFTGKKAILERNKKAFGIK